MAISDFNIEDVLFLMILGFSLAAPLGPVNMEMIKQVLRSKFGYILGIFTGLGALTGDFLVASFVLFLSIEFLKDFVENFYVFIISLHYRCTTALVLTPAVAGVYLVYPNFGISCRCGD